MNRRRRRNHVPINVVFAEIDRRWVNATEPIEEPRSKNTFLRQLGRLDASSLVPKSPKAYVYRESVHAIDDGTNRQENQDDVRIWRRDYVCRAVWPGEGPLDAPNTICLRKAPDKRSLFASFHPVPLQTWSSARRSGPPLARGARCLDV